MSEWTPPIQVDRPDGELWFLIRRLVYVAPSHGGMFAVKEENADAADLIAAQKQHDALRTEVLEALLPEVERFGQAIYETDGTTWDHALPWHLASKTTKAHYFALGLAARMAACGTLGVTDGE